MSQQLMDYVTARHDAITAALMMLTAEMMLSDEYSSVLELAGAEEEMERTARDLTDAVNALPLTRWPVGWSEAPAPAGDITVARGRFVKAVLRCLSAQYAGESAHADAEAEYADDQLALAARNLVADADARRAAKAGTRGGSCEAHPSNPLVIPEAGRITGQVYGDTPGQCEAGTGEPGTPRDG